MRTAFHRRGVAFALALILAFTDILPAASALAGPGDVSLKDSANYLSLSVNSSGRFRLESAGGLPWQPSDDGKALLDRSFASFRVGGQDYIFGNGYGAAGGLISAPAADVGTESVSTSWKIGDVEVTQHLVLLTAPGSDTGNLLVSYTVKNTGPAAVDVGARVLFDTLLGQNDGPRVMIPGTSVYLTNETTIEPAPSTWRAVDSLLPEVMVYGQNPSGGGTLPPDTMVLAHWAGIAQSKWDYVPDPNLNFTTTENVYGSADLAVALYWDEDNLGAGEERVYATLYGLGDLASQADAGSYDFDVLVVAPTALTVNAAKDGYVENPLTLSLEIANTRPSSEIMIDVDVAIDLRQSPGALRLADGENATKSVAYIPAGYVKTFSWRVQPTPSYAPRVAKFRFNMAYNVWVGGTEFAPRTRTVNGVVLMPSLPGDPPPLQVTGITPSVVHLGETPRQVTLHGGGFDILQWPDTAWNLILYPVTAPGNVISIPQDDDHLTFMGNKLIVTIPDSAVLKEELYQLELSTVGHGNFTQQVAFSNDDTYLTKTYGILVAYKEAGGAAYKLEPVADETALATLKSQVGSRLLLDIRGQVLEMRGSFGDYTGKFYRVLPDATINGKVRYGTDQLLVDIYGEGYHEIVAYADRGSVYLEGAGSLSVPTMHFYSGTFNLALHDGHTHSLAPAAGQEDVRIEWDWETAPKNTIAWLGPVPMIADKIVLGTDTVNLTGLLFLFVNEALTEGDTSNVVNVLNAGLAVHKAEYKVTSSGIKLNGVQAEGKIGLLDKMFPIKGVRFGAQAWAVYDTITPIYEIGASLNIIVVDLECKIVVKEAHGVLGIDTIHIFVGGSPGIPLVAPYAVVYITHGGGGFEGVMDTFAGRYRTVPPLKAYIMGGASLAKVLALKRATITVGFREIGIRGDINLAIVPILQDLEAYMRYDDATGSFELKGGGKLGIMGVLTGEVGIALRYVPGDDFGLFGPVWLGGWASANFGIPDWVPVVGGYKVVGGGAEISSERLYAHGVLLKIPVSAEYKWGSAGVTLSADLPDWLGGLINIVVDSVVVDGMGDGESMSVMGGMSMGDEMSMMSAGFEEDDTQSTGGQFAFGGNLGVVGTSENNSIPVGPSGITGPSGESEKLPEESMMMSMGAMGAGEDPPVTSNLDFTEHYLNMDGVENALALLRFVGDVPAYAALDGMALGEIIGIKKPDGSDFVLVPDDPETPDDDGTANCRMQVFDTDHSSSGMVERLISIGIPNPEPGIWTVTTAVSTTSVALVNASNVPAIANVGVVGDVSTGHNLEVTWETEALAGDEKVMLLLCTDEKDASGNLIDPGTPIVSGGEMAVEIDAEDGLWYGVLSDNVPSGDYYVRAVLYKTDPGGGTINISSSYSLLPVTVIDPHQPSAPASVSIEAVGDGNFEVKWSPVVGVDGYCIDVLDASGNPLEQTDSIPVTADEVELDELGNATIVIGGTFKVSAPDDTGEGSGEPLGDYPEGTLGLVPGSSYKVGVSSYRSVDAVTRFSPMTISGALDLPEPTPPTLVIDVLDGSGEPFPWAEVGGTKVYQASSKPVTLRVQSADAISLLSVQTLGVLADYEEEDLDPGEAWEQELGLIEGEQRIDVAATDAEGDVAQQSFRIVLDTTPPVLNIQHPVVVRHEGPPVTWDVTISGWTDVGATLRVNGNVEEVNEDGTFSVTLPMGADMVSVYEITSTDEAGNTSSGRREAIRSDLLKRVELRPVNASGAVLPKPATGILDVILGEQHAFRLVGFDVTDDMYVIPASMTTFETLLGADFLTDDGDGQWIATAKGRAIISASFGVEDEFTFYDTVTMDIRASDDPPPSSNRPPQVALAVADMTVAPGEKAEVDLTSVFVDPDGDELSWTAKHLEDSPDAPQPPESIGLISSGKWEYTAADDDDGEAFLIELRATDTGSMYSVLSFGLFVDSGIVPHAPKRRAEVPAEEAASVTVNTEYTLDLSEIFEDEDGDPLSYTVSIGGADPVNAVEEYSYTPTSVGTVTLVFVANDGTEDSTDTYTVTLSVVAGSSGPTDSVPEDGQDAPQAFVSVGGVQRAFTVSVDRAKASASIDLGLLARELFGTRPTPRVTMPAVSGVTEYALGLPAAELAGGRGGKIEFATPLGSVVVPDDMLATAAGLDGKKAAVAIGIGDKSGLDPDVLQALGDRPIVQLGLRLDGNAVPWDNPDAAVTVSIPYTPLPAELADPEHIVVWYLDGEGNAVSVPNGRYDPETGTVTFVVTHFSQYAIAVVHKTFDDIEGFGWAKREIEVMASKGVVKGTSATTYDPSAHITRADFMLLLVRTLGLSGRYEAEADGNFADVSPLSYYHDTLGLARKAGVAQGIGDNMFNPLGTITRQDMMVLTTRALAKVKGLEPADAVDAAVELALKGFLDREEIADYAARSVAALVSEGLIQGTDGLMNPNGFTTRAEAAVFLYRVYGHE